MARRQVRIVHLYCYIAEVVLVVWNMASESRVLMRELRILYRLLRILEVDWRPSWIPSAAIIYADRLSLEPAKYK